MVLCTGRVRKTVILVTTLTVGQQMFPNTSWLMKMHILTPLCNLATRWGIHNLTGEKYIFWPHCLCGKTDAPTYMLTREKCIFCMFPKTGWLEKSSVFCPILSIGHHTGGPVEKCHFVHYFNSGPPNGKLGHQMQAVWPYFSSGHEMGNLSFNIGGGLNGPLPFAASL